MTQYFRNNIVTMDSYVPGIQPKESGVIKLNTNENPYPPTSKVIETLIKGINGKLRLYPDPLCDNLREKIGSVCNVDMDQIIVGNGSDEILTLIMRSIVDPNDDVLLLYPTYTLYHVLAKEANAKILEYELDENFQIPEPFFAQKCKLCYVPNPNVPAGNLVSKNELERIAFNIKGILVIDEAYVDFAEEDSIDLLKKHDNIIITRSFSKSFSLAGMRIGFAISSKEIIKNIMKIKDSYNVNRLSAIAAETALDDIAVIKDQISVIKHRRDRYSDILRKMQFQVLPSQTNFLFVKPPCVESKYLYEKLWERKILVRFFNQPRVNDYLRITIGTEEEMSYLVKNIEEILEIYLTK